MARWAGSRRGSRPGVLEGGRRRPRRSRDGEGGGGTTRAGLATGDRLVEGQGVSGTYPDGRGTLETDRGVRDRPTGRGRRTAEAGSAAAATAPRAPEAFRWTAIVRPRRSGKGTWRPAVVQERDRRAHARAPPRRRRRRRPGRGTAVRRCRGCRAVEVGVHSTARGPQGANVSSTCQDACWASINGGWTAAKRPAGAQALRGAWTSPGGNSYRPALAEHGRVAVARHGLAGVTVQRPHACPRCALTTTGSRRDRRAPAADPVRGRPRVERVVQLAGGQPRRVVGQEARRSQAGGVEARDPARVREPAGAGEDATGRAPGGLRHEAHGSLGQDGIAQAVSGVTPVSSSLITLARPRSIAARSAGSTTSRK